MAFTDLCSFVYSPARRTGRGWMRRFDFGGTDQMLRYLWIVLAGLFVLISAAYIDSPPKPGDNTAHAIAAPALAFPNDPVVGL
jgi:hypothetical protein